MWLSVHFLPYIDNEKPHNTRKISILFNFFHSEIRKLNLYMRTITVSKQARIISIFFVLFLSLLGSTDFRFTSHIFQLLIDYGFFFILKWLSCFACYVFLAGLCGFSHWIWIAVRNRFDCSRHQRMEWIGKLIAWYVDVDPNLLLWRSIDERIGFFSDDLINNLFRVSSGKHTD